MMFNENMLYNVMKIKLHGKKLYFVFTDSACSPPSFLKRCVCLIKMDLREIGWDGVDWVDLAQDRDHWRALVNMVMNLQVP
jgi:hypothetical protein